MRAFALKIPPIRIVERAREGELHGDIVADREVVGLGGARVDEQIAPRSGPRCSQRSGAS